MDKVGQGEEVARGIGQGVSKRWRWDAGDGKRGSEEEMMGDKGS